MTKKHFRHKSANVAYDNRAKNIEDTKRSLEVPEIFNAVLECCKHKFIGLYQLLDLLGKEDEATSSIKSFIIKNIHEIGDNIDEVIVNVNNIVDLLPIHISDSGLMITKGNPFLESQEEIESSIQDATSIHYLTKYGLSLGAVAKLARNKIYTIGQLKIMTANKLLKKYSIGPTYAEEIQIAIDLLLSGEIE